MAEQKVCLNRVCLMVLTGFYCLGAFGPPIGASLGLQASGLPSGAQQVPVTVPFAEVKLHSFPLLSALHDARACAGGLGGPPLPSAGCAESAQHAVSAPEKRAIASSRLTNVRLLIVFFIQLIQLSRQSPALPSMDCGKKMW